MNDRPTFYDFKTSLIPGDLGECAANSGTLAQYVNEAQRRLVYAGGENGWWGGWAKMLFNVDPAVSMITTARDVARLIHIDVCRKPVSIQNEFFEFLEFGSGLMRLRPTCAGRCSCKMMQAYDRGTTPTTAEFVSGNKVRAFYTNIADVGKRVLIQGTYPNGLPIYSIYNGFQITGFYLTLDTPFVESAFALGSVTNIQKDVTLAPVSLFQVDPASNPTILVMLDPREMTPSYRRYFIDNLPDNCHECDSPCGTVQVTALAALDFIPVTVDSDFLLIRNLSALREECMAIRYSRMDDPKALAMSDHHHKEAIKLLNRELKHYEGDQGLAVNFAPFGWSTLEQANLQMI